MATGREYVYGGWLELTANGLWRIAGPYMFGATIENIPTKELALRILEALEETQINVQDSCYSSIE
jgi:hypothetical protein